MIFSILKSIGAVVAGLLAGLVIVAGLEFVSHFLFPLPPGLTIHSPDFAERVMNEVPLGAKILVLVAWAIGVTAACFLAAFLAPTAPWIHGLIPGTMFFLFGILTMIMIPHPLWFMVCAIVMYPAAILAGCYLGAKPEALPQDAS